MGVGSDSQVGLDPVEELRVLNTVASHRATAKSTHWRALQIHGGYLYRGALAAPRMRSASRLAVSPPAHLADLVVLNRWAGGAACTSAHAGDIRPTRIYSRALMVSGVFFFWREGGSSFRPGRVVGRYADPCNGAELIRLLRLGPLLDQCPLSTLQPGCGGLWAVETVPSPCSATVSPSPSAASSVSGPARAVPGGAWRG